VTVTLRKNGTVIGSVNASGTNTGGSIDINSAIAAGDVLSIDTSSTDPSAAVDCPAIVQILNAAT